MAKAAKVKAETYTQGEVSKLASVTRPTIRYWEEKGLIPKPTREGRVVKYSAAAVDSFLKTRAAKVKGKSTVYGNPKTTGTVEISNA